MYVCVYIYIYICIYISNSRDDLGREIGRSKAAERLALLRYLKLP